MCAYPSISLHFHIDLGLVTKAQYVNIERNKNKNQPLYIVRAVSLDGTAKYFSIMAPLKCLQ